MHYPAAATDAGQPALSVSAERSPVPRPPSRACVLAHKYRLVGVKVIGSVPVPRRMLKCRSGTERNAGLFHGTDKCDRGTINLILDRCRASMGQA